MKKNTKKKVFTLMLVIMLLSIAIVGGSLAWFTAEDEATNTFTVGSIKIEQIEQQLDENKNKVPYNHDEEKVLLPIVKVDSPSEDDNYQDKIVTVKNTGKNEAYICTHIAIPSALYYYLTLDFNPNTDWKFESSYNTEIDGTDYFVRCYTQYTALEPEKETAALLNGVYMNANVDVQIDPADPNNAPQFCLRNADGTIEYSGFAVEDATEIDVLVLTQAVQADGFTGCLDALEKAFGEFSEDNNPFVAQ